MVYDIIFLVDRVSQLSLKCNITNLQSLPCFEGIRHASGCVMLPEAYIWSRVGGSEEERSTGGQGSFCNEAIDLKDSAGLVL